MPMTSSASATKTSRMTSLSAATTTTAKVATGTVHNILKILNSRLGSKGNINDSKDVVFITELMREAEKLVDKCMFLNVLLETHSPDLLSTVLNNGGWTVLHNWLLHSKATDSKSFLVELLRLYKRLPVTVDLLRQNSCAKDIKQLSKCPDTKVAGLSKSIISCWMEKVKEKTTTTSSISSSSNVTEATKRSEKPSSRTENTQNHYKSSSKLSWSKKTSSTVKDSVSVINESEETDPSRVKTLCDSPDHISAKLNQRMLSVDHVVSTSAVVSAAASDDSSNSSTNTETTTASHRPKTVKTLGSKMRSTGLEVDDPLPPSKKKSLSQSTDKIPSKTPSSKKSLPENKSTVVTSASVIASSTVTSSSLASKPKPKLIPPRPRAPEIFESSGFMDALSSTDVVPGRRKRKLLSVSTAKSSTSASSAAMVPASPEDKKSPPPSFYRDTMEVSSDDVDVKPDTAAAADDDDDKITSLDDSVATDDVVTVSESTDVDIKTEEDTGSIQQEQLTNEDSSASTYSSSEPAAKKKRVKRVSWVDESKLCSYFYFQLDESERVNVNRAKDFAETRKHEQEMERQVMQNVRRMAHDTMTEKQQWRKPRLITGLSSVAVHGYNSKERDIQREREQSVLLVLYFNKNTIPDSAGEPEAEYCEFTEPRIIPLHDETGLGSEINYETYTTTTTTTSAQNTPAPLPPAIADLLASTTRSAPVTDASPAPVPAVAPSNNNAPLLPQQQPTPAPQYNIPPLPMFLNMPLPMQQQIFRSVPVHIQQQMLSSLPPPLQNQLGPLMGTTTAPNNAPPFPPDGDVMPPMMRPHSLPPNFSRRPTGPPPFVGVPGPDSGRPQRPPVMMRGAAATPMSARVCTHFLAGNCRFGATCRKLHPARDVPATSPPRQDHPPAPVS